VAFTSPSERSHAQPELLATPDESRVVSSSSRGLTRLHPSTDQSFVRRLPRVPKHPLRATAFTQRPRSVRVVSHHLDGFLRTTTASLLRPAVGHEVRRVSHPPATRLSEDILATRFVPRNAVRTLRRVPLISSRTASLRSLPSYRLHSISGLNAVPTEAGSVSRRRRRSRRASSSCKHVPKPAPQANRVSRKTRDWAQTRRWTSPPPGSVTSEEAPNPMPNTRR